MAFLSKINSYKAADDEACHASENKKTEHTKTFWLPGGNIYYHKIVYIYIYIYI